MLKFKDFMKEMAGGAGGGGGPVNNVGSGNIAGIGIGAQGEPGMRKDPMRRYKLANKKGERKLTRSIVMTPLAHR